MSEIRDKTSSSLSLSSKELEEDILKGIRTKLEAAGVTKEEEKASEKRSIQYPKGWVKYSSLFGKNTSGIEHAVRLFVREDWPESVRHLIPDKDPDYIFPELETEEFVVALMAGDKTLLHGPKGSGKSTITEQVCARINMPFMRVNCREDMDSSAVFGAPKIEAGTMSYAHGPAGVLGMSGGLLQIDEISLSPAGINMAMQWMLEENGKIYLADMPDSSEHKFIKPVEWFRIVATDNTQLQGDTNGNYAGAQVQNEALLDRFQTTIYLGYLEPAHEKKVVSAKVPGVESRVLNQMIRLAGVVRSAYDKNELQFTMSPRTLINWARKYRYWENLPYAFRLSFYNKLIDDDKKQVSEMYFKVFKETL